jgi:Ca2+-binding RTX toxin-like protein
MAEFIGTDGDDIIHGTDEYDVIRGLLGNDQLFGEGGNDVLRGSKGSDSLYGGLGNDTLYGEGNNDFLYGEAGNDRLDGGNGLDVLDGGAGADIMEGGKDSDTYYVDDTEDEVVEFFGGGGSADHVHSSASWTMSNNVERLTLTGTANIDATGNDEDFGRINGNSGDNFIRGLGGEDHLLGFGGNDELDGGVGNDTVEGGAGTDILRGGSGDDYLNGHSQNFPGGGPDDNANDVLNGGSGDDRLEASGGNDTLAGGDGDDTYLVREFSATLVEQAGGGTDWISIANQSWTLGQHFEDFSLSATEAGIYVLEGNDAANEISAGADSDIADGVEVSIYGLGGNDRLGVSTVGSAHLDGGAGNDILWGLSSSDDVLIGGQGNDLVVIGSGHDTATGGAGNDRFYLYSNAELESGTILDFHGNQDDILIYASTLPGMDFESRGVAASEFVAGSAATTAAHRFIYDASAGALYYDSDGTGAAAQTLLANLNIVGGTFNHQDMRLSTDDV